MKNERLFAITNHLLAHGRTGAPELARVFEVSERTIYRDIESLSSRGVPVIGFAGAGGGFEIAEGFRVERSFLSGEEIADLTGVLKGFSEALKDARLASSLGKLAGLGSRASASGARRVRGDRAALGASGRPGGTGEDAAPPLLVTLTPWGGPSPDAALVERLRRAIASRQVVCLRYRDSRGAPSERLVEPFSVVLGGASWYLHAWCRLRRGFRLFRLSRVIEAAASGEVFDPWLRAPVPDPFAGSGEEVLIEVELRAAAERADGFREAFGRAAVGEPEQGKVRVRFRAPDGEWLVRHVLSLGAGIEVVAPLSLRRVVRAAAIAVARANWTPSGRSKPDMRCQGQPVSLRCATEDSMSQMMLSTCGLDCNTCPARMAFLHDDPELRRRTAEEWSKAYNVQISADAVFCSGCRVADGPKIGHCGECEVRLCGIAHGVATCGECADYPGCPTIAKYLEMMPGNRERLDAARAAR